MTAGLLPLTRRSCSLVQRPGAKALAALLVALACLAAPDRARAATRYVFSAFTDSAEKLSVYTSTDGLEFSLLSNTGYTGPTGVLRDPSIMKHTDGNYYIAHTTNSWTTNSTSFAIAYSPNLINWTYLTTINAGVNGVRDTWAPEWFKDSDGTVNLIVSIDTLGTDSDFRAYKFTANNSALTSWSGPVPIGIGPNYIDTFIVKSGSTYHAFSKNETSKYIEHATSSSLTGPWSWVGTGNWAGWGSGKEGPALFQLDNGQWRIFMDCYSGCGYLYATSPDLYTWSGLTTVPGSLSGVVRHGTVIRETAAVYTLTARHSGKLADVNGGSTSNGAAVIQWPANGGANQQWQLQDAGGGYSRLVNAGSGKCLDVSNVSTADGAKVIQWTCGTGQNQQWKLKDLGTGWIQLAARHSGKCLDVTSGSADNGAQLVQQTCGSSASQQWQRR